MLAWRARYLPWQLVGKLLFGAICPTNYNESANWVFKLISCIYDILFMLSSNIFTYILCDVKLLWHNVITSLNKKLIPCFSTHISMYTILLPKCYEFGDINLLCYIDIKGSPSYSVLSIYSAIFLF